MKKAFVNIEFRLELFKIGPRRYLHLHREQKVAMQKRKKAQVKRRILAPYYFCIEYHFFQASPSSIFWIRRNNLYRRVGPSCISRQGGFFNIRLFSFVQSFPTQSELPILWIYPIIVVIAKQPWISIVQNLLIIAPGTVFYCRIPEKKDN